MLALALITALSALALPLSALTTLAAPADASPGRAENEAPAQLYVRGLPETTLVSDLALRSPDLEVAVAAGSTAPVDTGATIIVVRPQGEGFALTVILSDGRAYDREVASSPEQAPRAVATALANLMAAISEERVLADRESVNVLAELATVDDGATTTPPESSPEDSPPEPEPGPGPGPGPDTPTENARPPQDDPTPPAPPELPAVWSLGPELSPVALLALDQEPELPTFGSAGLLLAVVARSPRGLRLGLSGRGLWRITDGVTLHRARASLLGGYGLRRGRFSLSTDLLLHVEHWQLREEGERLALNLAEEDVAIESTPMLGFGLRLTPAYEVPLGEKGRARLRLGATAEIGYSGVLEDGLQAVNLMPEDDGPHFRIGGVELALGAQVGLRFDLPRRRPRR